MTPYCIFRWSQSVSLRVFGAVSGLMWLMFNPSSLSALDPISRRASPWRKWKLTDAHARSSSHPREADWRVYTQQSARPAPHLEPGGKGRFLTAFIQLFSLKKKKKKTRLKSTRVWLVASGSCVCGRKGAQPLFKWAPFTRGWEITRQRARARMHGALATQTFISAEVDDKHGNIPADDGNGAGASDVLLLLPKLTHQRELLTSLTPVCIIWWGRVDYSHPVLIVLGLRQFLPASPWLQVCEDHVFQCCVWIISDLNINVNINITGEIWHFTRKVNAQTLK